MDKELRKLIDDIQETELRLKIKCALDEFTSELKTRMSEERNAAYNEGYCSGIALYDGQE